MFKPQAPRVIGETPGLRRSTVVLTAALVEAFADKYLAPNYDQRRATPWFHKEIWRECASEWSHVLILAPRGHAKSTSVTVAYGLSALMFRQRDFAVIISNTLSQSIEFLRQFKTELTENLELVQEFGVRKLLKDTEDDIIVEMGDKHRFRVVARGSEQKVRGLLWRNRRPNLILCDDLEDDEQVSSRERRVKFGNWFMRAVLPFGADDCLFRVSATILHFDSLANTLAKDDGWHTLRYKAHESFGNFTNILWPEKFSEERLRAIQRKYLKKGDRDGYSQEYLNIPIAEGNSYFRPDDLLPMEDVDRLVPVRKIAAWDLAISLKETADYTVCVVVGVDSKGRRFVLDVRRDRWESDKIIEEMFNVQKAHNCEVHLVEAEKIDKAIGPFLYTKMRDEGLYFNVEPRRPIGDKVSRARSWQAATRARNVFFDHQASWWPDLLEEMKHFPKWEHDDQVDAQSLIGLELEGLQRANTQEEQSEEEYATMVEAHADEGRSIFTGY